MKRTLKAFGIMLLAGSAFVVGCGEKAEKKAPKEKSGGAAETAEASSDAPVREIAFPEDKVVGRLKARPAGSDNPQEWQELGDARGTVKAPPTHDIMLDLTGYNITDISFLTSLNPDDIQELVLEGCNIGDDSLSSVDVLRLKGLNLNGNPITDQGLDFIATFDSLEKLSLGKTQTTDAGLGTIGPLINLKKLWLQETAITNAGLAQLQSLQSLEFLVLYDTAITDAGLDALKVIPTLKRLGLRGTKVTDAGLEKLIEFPALEEVDVANTSITREAANQISARQPRIKFLFEIAP